MQIDKFLFDEVELKTALAAILHRNSPKWMKISRAILRNREEAEDVLNEAVWRMLRRDRSFPSREHIRKYMGRVVSNTALEFYNRRKRERRQYAQILENIMTKSAENQSDALRPDFIMEEEERYEEHENRLALLRSGLEELPMHQYEAIRLIAFSNDGSTFRDAESASGIPSATIRYRYMQGMRTLRKYMARGRNKQIAAGISRDSFNNQHLRSD